MSGRVVAELGRPETPEETAERKARDRALRRSRQNFRNLTASVVVCVIAVAVIAVLLPNGGGAVQQPAIDVASVAKGLTPTAGQPLLAPAVPSGWRANAAELRGTGTATGWYVGWVVDGSGYAGLTEGVPGTAASLSDALDRAKPTGTADIGGLPWRVYDRRSLGSAAGNVAYGLATRIGDVRIAVYGTVSAQRVQDLARLTAEAATQQHLTGAAALP